MTFIDDFAEERAAIREADGIESCARTLTVSSSEFLAERDEGITSFWGDGLLVPGGGYTIASGEGGVCKTIILGGLLIHLAAGRTSFLGYALPGEPVPCLILEAEGSRSKFRERIRTMARSYGLNAAKLPLFFHARDAALSIEQTLDSMIAESGARVAFLDSIGHFYDGDENFSRDWRNGVTKPLGEISRERAVAICFADHYSKPSETRQGRHKTRGATSKVDDCGAAFRLEYGKGGMSQRVLFWDRVRDAGLPDPAQIALKVDVSVGTVELDPDGCIDSAAGGAIRSANEAAVSEAMATTYRELRKIMEGKRGPARYPPSTRELESIVGGNRATQAEARRRMEAEGGLRSERKGEGRTAPVVWLLIEKERP